MLEYINYCLLVVVTICFHYRAQKVNSFIATNMSRKVLITEPYTEVQKGTTRDRQKSITLTFCTTNSTAKANSVNFQFLFALLVYFSCEWYNQHTDVPSYICQNTSADDNLLVLFTSASEVH